MQMKTERKKKTQSEIDLNVSLSALLCQLKLVPVKIINYKITRNVTAADHYAVSFP